MLGAVSLWNFIKNMNKHLISFDHDLVLLCYRTDGRTLAIRLIDIRQASEEQLTNEQAALQAEVKREKQLAATWTTMG